MKAKWPKVVGTSVPIFGGTVVLCCSKAEYEQAERYLGAHDENRRVPNAGVCQAVRTADGKRMYLVGVFDASPVTLAHEVAHACFFILGDVGVPVVAGETNETFCYLLGYLIAEQTPHLRKRK